MTATDLPSGMELARDAFRAVGAHRDALFRIAVLPLAAEFAAALLLRPQGPLDPSTFLLMAINIVLTTLFGVAWLRRLLDADAGDPPLPYRWSSAHTRFAAALLALVVIAAIAVVPFALIAQAGAGLSGFVALIAGVGVSFLIFLRLAMTLVGAAIGRPCGFGESWRATGSGAAQYVLGAMFAFMPVLVLIGVFVNVAQATGLAGALPLMTTLMLLALVYVGHALVFAVTALVYRLRFPAVPKGPA
jgi:hypothetical protein